MTMPKMDKNWVFQPAIDAFRRGNFEEAARLAEAAREESSAPDVAAFQTFFAGLARTWNCHREEALGECNAAVDFFEEAELLAGICGPQVDCEPLQREAAVWGAAAKIVSERLTKRLGEAIAKIDSKKKSYQPNNLRLPGIAVKESKMLSNLMQFDPPLKGVHYIPERVYSEFHLENGQWISSTSGLRPYFEKVAPTHHYSGRRLAFYTPAGELFPLSVPDDFVLNAASVEINGRHTGFDLLESSEGIVYARLRTRKFGPISVAFEMRSGERQPSPDVEPAAQNDLLGDVSLPGAVTELFSQTRFMGAREIYQETKRLIEETVGYPTDGDLLSGRAIFEADDGREFFSKIWKMELADCDMANTLGVALLRRQGIAARLVTGYLMQGSSVGLHGWLEFFDEGRKEWVKGDMTPPLREKPSEYFVQPQVAVNSHSFQLTKHEEKPVDDSEVSSVDQFWTFRGNKMVLSKPDGRYLATLSKKRDEIQAYDLEKEIWITLPNKIVPSVNVDENWKAFETPEGVMVELNASEEVMDGSGVPYISQVVLEKDQGFTPAFLRDTRAYADKATTENKIYFTKFPKVVALQWPTDNPETNAFLLDSSGEDSRGEVHVIVKEVVKKTNHQFYYKYYYLHLEPPQAKASALDVTREMLRETICEGDAYHPCKIAQSPDGSHFAVYFDDDESNPMMLHLRVFEKGREVYRFQRLKAECDEVACTHPFEWVNVRVNNDGSAVIKESGRDSRRTWNFNSRGEHEFEKEKLWKVEQQTDAELELVVSGFNGKGEEGEIYRRGLGAADRPDFSKISWGGNWVALGSTVYQCNPQTKAFSSISGLDISLCSDRHGELLCLDLNSYPVATVITKMTSFYFKPDISLPEDWNDGRAWRSYSWAPSLHEVGESIFWEGNIEAVNGFRDKIVSKEKLKTLPSAAIVHRREDGTAAALKKLLLNSEQKRLFPPVQELRDLLGSVASTPEVKVFYEWPMIGAAKLFESEAACLGSEGATCSRELSAAHLFREKEGEALALRFEPHIKESTHFPNRSLVVEAWSSHLLARPALLKEMLAEDTALAAEAVFKIVEKGMIDSLKFPPMFLEKEATLTAALQILLTRHRERTYSDIQRSNASMLSYRLEAYQALSRSLAKRFSANVLPDRADTD